MQSADIRCCVVIIEAIGEILDAPCLEDSSVPNKVKLVQLCSVVRNQGAKTRGAGLRGGLLVEELWTGMLFEAKPDQFQKIGEPADADYAFRATPTDAYAPISHKTIGYLGSGDLALAWSKNPSGQNKSDFKSNVGILFFRKSPQRASKKFSGLKNGFYLVPASYMNTHVSGQLGSNNKTDSLISAQQTEAAMREALKNDCFIELPYDDNWGVGKAIDPWPKGLASVSTTHQPPAPNQLANIEDS